MISHQIFYFLLIIFIILLLHQQISFFINFWNFIQHLIKRFLSQIFLFQRIHSQSPVPVPPSTSPLFRKEVPASHHLFKVPTPWTSLSPFLKSLFPLPHFLFHPLLTIVTPILTQPPTALIRPIKLPWFKQISKGRFYQYNCRFLSKINFWYFISFYKKVILIYEIFSGSSLDNLV